MACRRELGLPEVVMMFKYYKINVMITVQELLNHLEDRIAGYRREGERITTAKDEIRSGKIAIAALGGELKGYITQQLQAYHRTFEEGVVRVNDYFETQIQRQKRCYEREIYDLRSEIERQYKVISNMRQEVEDLQELIIMQNAKKEEAGKGQVDGEREGEKKEEGNQVQTIYGLEVIEQETERTVMSSVKSFHEENCSNHENFIRIQEKQHEESSQSQVKSNKACSTIQMKESNNVESNFSNSQFLRIQESEQASEVSQDKCSGYKLQQIMNSSNVSKRQNTYQFDQNSEEPFEKYESLPLTIDGYLTKEFKQEESNGDELRGWEQKNIGNVLKEITNDKNQYSQEDRQSKTKMFLEQFRKTFNKCLSSNNISRKNSSKVEKTGKKSKSRDQKRKSSRDKGMGGAATASKADSEKADNQKFLNDVLKDSYNDNKFCVGNRRTQLKYDGQRKGNVKHGNGVLHYSNGLCYEGEFKSNMRNGYGILRFNQIEIYRGEWLDDELSGQGKIRNFAVINKLKTQSTNSPLIKWVSYCGYFKNNRFQGEGTLYLGGQKFLGKFICGAACGQGTLYKKNGEIETGIWRNNQLVQQF